MTTYWNIFIMIGCGLATIYFSAILIRQRPNANDRLTNWLLLIGTSSFFFTGLINLTHWIWASWLWLIVWAIILLVLLVRYLQRRSQRRSRSDFK